MIQKIKQFFWRANQYPIVYDKLRTTVSALDIVRKNADHERKEFHSTLNRLHKQVQDWKKRYDQQTGPDVMDADAWDNRHKQARVWYAAPKNQLVTKYLLDKNYPIVDTIAMDIIEEYEVDKQLVKQNLDHVPYVVMKWVQDNKFKYKFDKSEKWNDPEDLSDVSFMACSEAPVESL